MATAILVTGASRGFGKAAAIALTSQLAIQKQKIERLDVILWARDETKLQETRQAINFAASGHNVDVQVTTTGVDLADQASYVHHVEALVETLQQKQPAYETIYVVHNAASVGTLGPAQAWQSASEIAAYWELNLTHVCFLNARLLAAFKSRTTRLVLVNVSSNVAVTPFGGCGLYCTSKAAREMHFRVIAEETKKDENRVRVLNYWPGALDTQMQDELRESPAFPDEIHAVFVGFKEQGQLASAEASASYCARVAVADSYETGSTVEYDASKLQ